MKWIRFFGVAFSFVLALSFFPNVSWAKSAKVESSKVQIVSVDGQTIHSTE